MTWDDFGAAARSLASAVNDAGCVPDIVVSIARGGLLPAGAIAYALDVKDIFVMNVEFYTAKGETLPDPRLLDKNVDFDALRDKKILVVDDVADSGRTLAFVRDMVAEYASETNVAVLYEKPRSVLKADFVWKQTDLWIAFPWSSLPPVTSPDYNSEA